MSKNQYYNFQIEEINKVKDLESKPTLLLHTCCGPCNTAVIMQLYQYFDVTIYYSNSNIYPIEEYSRRFEELEKFITIFNKEYHQDIKIIEHPYDPDTYDTYIGKYPDDYEGNIRCGICYGLRLRDTFEYANNHGYEYVCTVLTISRQKPSIKINEIANSIAKSYPNIKYFYSDFKKNNGIGLKQELTKKYNLYNQTYCGCKYSIRKKD